MKHPVMLQGKNKIQHSFYNSSIQQNGTLWNPTKI
jgi:hypothetical protein